MSKTSTMLAGIHCLVLDDEFLIALDIQDMLEQSGAASVTCVSNADDALATIRETKFDLAVLDLNLAGGTRTGLLVAAALTVQKIPFTFLTGMRRDAIVLTDYLHVPIVEKPYQPPLLLAAIQQALRVA